MNVQTQARAYIEQADTPAKVWALVALLLKDDNGYTDQTYLENARAYVAIAVEKTPPEGYTYDAEISDSRTAGFSNIAGDQWYAKRSELSINSMKTRSIK